MELSAAERDLILTNQSMLNSILSTLETVKCFKLDDIVIATDDVYNYAKGKVEQRVLKNSYGLPIKFKVVHVDDNGLPYIKELNKSGKPAGILKPMVRYERDNFGGIYANPMYNFIIDPDYADAIILDDVANFNPSDAHSIKAALRTEIVNHNKSCKLKFKNRQEVIAYMKGLAPNTVIWRSSTSFWTFINTKINNPKRGWLSDIEYEFQDSKGATVYKNPSELVSCNMYSAQPRSFSEFKNPK